MRMEISSLIREFALVQNPALGAVLLWRFCVAYETEHREGQHPPLQLAFLVLPLLLHRDTFEEVKGTRGSIHLFVEKFAKPDKGKNDVLLGIHERCLVNRRLTMESISIAIRTRLASIIPSTGRLAALSSSKASAIPLAMRPMAAGAERIGRWFASMTMIEIENALKVNF